MGLTHINESNDIKFISTFSSVLNLNKIIHVIENTVFSPQADLISQDEVIPKPETIVTDFKANVLIYMYPTFFNLCIYQTFKMKHIRKYITI